jgi:hypothetical protein
LIFRKNSELHFNYSVKNGEHDNLNLLENQIVLDLSVENGFILKVGKSYIPLLNDKTVFNINVPYIEQSGEIKLKIIGFFKSVKVTIPVDRSGVHLRRPRLSQNQLISNLDIQKNLNAGVRSLQIQIASINSKPKLFVEIQSNINSAQVLTISEPSFKHDLEKLELKIKQKLNQKL